MGLRTVAVTLQVPFQLLNGRFLLNLVHMAEITYPVPGVVSRRCTMCWSLFSKEY
jgi:hypothetical protein